MISGFAVNQVYLATGFTDMRKSINGLSAVGFGTTCAGSF